MKIVIAINNLEHGRALTRFVRRLHFSEAELHLIWVLPPLTVSPWDISGGTATVFDSELRTSEEVLVQKDLTTLTEELKSEGVQSRYTICSGNITRELLDYCDRESADLVVVGAFQHGAVGRLFLGGVSRGVVVSAKCSVLVVKLPRENSHPLRAVYATDLSDYGARCLVHFSQLGIKGIEEITVLHVYPEENIERLRRALPETVDEFKNHLLDKLVSEVKSSADDLKAVTAHRQSRVQIGDVNEVIEKTVHELHADLLVVGAQGHGWFERGALGSISFHHALYEPYSVFIIRI